MQQICSPTSTIPELCINYEGSCSCTAKYSKCYQIHLQYRIPQKYTEYIVPFYTILYHLYFFVFFFFMYCYCNLVLVLVNNLRMEQYDFLAIQNLTKNLKMKKLFLFYKFSILCYILGINI